MGCDNGLIPINLYYGKNPTFPFFIQTETEIQSIAWQGRNTPTFKVVCLIELTMTIDEIVAHAIPLNDECSLKRQRAKNRRIVLKERIIEMLRKTHNFTQTQLNEYIEQALKLDPAKSGSTS